MDSNESPLTRYTPLTISVGVPGGADSTVKALHPEAGFFGLFQIQFGCRYRVDTKVLQRFVVKKFSTQDDLVIA